MAKTSGDSHIRIIGAAGVLPSKGRKPQGYYDRIKQRFAEERDLRLKYRPEGTAQYTSDLSGLLGKVELDPRASEIAPREPIRDTVECLFIGGGFSALLASARLRERGVESIRIVERGADVGGTWYWNRYPGVACDVPSYDYLPLLDELDYVPVNRYAKGPEIHAHCQAIGQEVRPLRAGGLPDHGHLHLLGRNRTAVARIHRPRRRNEGSLRDLRQRHALPAKAWPAARWSNRALPARSRARRGSDVIISGRSTRRCRDGGPRPVDEPLGAQRGLSRAVVRKVSNPPRKRAGP